MSDDAITRLKALIAAVLGVGGGALALIGVIHAPLIIPIMMIVGGLYFVWYFALGTRKSDD